MKLPFLILLAYCIALSSESDETELRLNFSITWNDQELKLTEDEDLVLGEGLTLSLLKFYISKIQLVGNADIIYTVDNSYHLIDAADSSSLSIAIAYPEDFDPVRLQFHLGIDSLTNYVGAQGGDLDPMHGMYWTWQSGYINFKLEGTSTKSPARLNRYQYHIGGFQAPHNCGRTLSFELGDTKEINIDFQLDELLSSINFEDLHKIMSPSEKAMYFADDLVDLFQIQN